MAQVNLHGHARGKYCIARYVSSCPSGFDGGYMHCDEDSSNANAKQFQMGTMIAILEFSIVAEVMVVLMN